MAAAAAAEDLTTCSICIETFTDPRCLPCVHSFCVACIRRHCRDRQSGDKVSCPVCRSEFVIPANGVEGLPHNFFIQTLIDARREDDRAGIGQSVTATQCQKHPGKQVELYCFQCKTNICVLCFAVNHQQHKCQEIEEAASSFIDKIDGKMQNLLVTVDELEREVREQNNEEKRYTENAEQVCREIEHKGEEIKQLIDKEVSELKRKSEAMKLQKVDEIQSERQRLETDLTSLRRFISTWEEIKSRNNPSSITQVHSDMQDTISRFSHQHMSRCERSDFDNSFLRNVVQHVRKMLKLRGISFYPTNVDELLTTTVDGKTVKKSLIGKVL